jgi:serine O-acetyltransferase
MREDIQTVFDKDPAAKTALEVVFLYPGLHAIWLHRAAHWLWQHGLHFAGRWVSHVNRWLTGIEIHPGAKIGRRVFIDHGMGVVIGETAEVGDDVLMYQGVVLGGTSLQKKKRHPTVGKNVVIGTGSIVLGPINVGDNAKIGAGSVVVRAVPAGATVVGVPARMIGRPEPGELRMDLEHGALPDPVLRTLSESLDRTGRLEERVQQLEKALSRLGPAPAAALAPATTMMVDELEQRVREALNQVIDPETGISVVEMKLIRDIQVEDERVRVDVLLDNPNCPMVEYLVDQIRRKAKGVNGVTDVQVTLLDQPPGVGRALSSGMRTNAEAESYVG